MRIPTIHGNGTDADSLLEQLAEVSRACSALQDKLTDAMPNGRDYYVQGDGALQEAQNEWDKRRRAVEKIRLDMEAIADGIWNQRA